MKLYSDALSKQRRIEFRRANRSEKELLKGSHYLLLKNAIKLTDKQKKHLDRLLAENQNIHALYVLKEQLQTLWLSNSVEEMDEALEAWCQLADETNLLYLQKFSKSLRLHRVGICNYAKHSLTSARIEAGNVTIGMIRKRARGIRDTDYFKIKIRQSSVSDNRSMFYQTAERYLN